MKTPFLLSLFALFVISGCSSSDDGLGEAEGEKRVTVTDDDPLARIQVVAPAGWRSRDAREDISFAGNPLTLGQVTRLPEQSGCVQVRSQFATAPRACGVAIQKGTTTTYKLSTVATKYDHDRLQVDFGRKADKISIVGKFRDEQGALSEMELGEHAMWPVWTGDGERSVLALPGEYRFSWNIPVLGSFTKKVSAGQSMTVGLSPSDARATVRIVPPTSRDLPDAPRSSCYGTQKDRYWIVDRGVENNGRFGDPRGGGDEGVFESRSFVGDAPIELKMFPFTASEGPRHYEVVVNDIPVKLDLSPGKKKTLRMERLDVDHVRVTDEDGKVSDVPGSYTVEWKTPNGYRPLREGWAVSYGSCTRDVPPASFPTGTGLDLPPGSYRVAITYSTQTGGIETQTRLVSLP